VSSSACNAQSRRGGIATMRDAGVLVPRAWETGRSRRMIQTGHGTGERPLIIEGEFHGDVDGKLRKPRFFADWNELNVQGCADSARAARLRTAPEQT
jgi:hypothetical protein